MVFATWQKKQIGFCKNINETTKPKQFFAQLSEDLLASFDNLQLINAYNIYQHLMNIWNETMQDDTYVIVSDGWLESNKVYSISKETKNKSGKLK